MPGEHSGPGTSKGGGGHPQALGVPIVLKNGVWVYGPEAGAEAGGVVDPEDLSPGLLSRAPGQVTAHDHATGNKTPASGGGSKPKKAAAGSGGNNVQQIITFLRGKGLNDHVIAGILGNFKIESGFDPNAYNSREGAIGIGQWEGGRRSALQSYASAHGGQENDLQMQLGYMWQELSGPEAGVLAQLQGTSSASAAATIWDSQYERSSGEARQSRINYATQYDSQSLQGISSATSPAGAPLSAGAGNGGQGAAGGGGTAPTTQQYKAQLGQLGAVLGSVPELKDLLAQAQAGDWTVGHLQDMVEASTWYKTHSSTARSVIAQQLADPATYQRNLNTARSNIQALANQNGWTLTPDQLSAMASSALLSGNDGNQQWIAQQVGRKQDYSSLTSTDTLKGGMAATVTQLQQMAASYGQNTDPSHVAQKAQSILEGKTTIDTYRQLYEAHARSMYPGLADAFDRGLTVTDVAQPYVQSMSSLLEMDPATIDFNTPLIKKALQGTQSVTDGKSTVPAVLPVWQFEDQVRNDPRWGYTDNAHAQSASMLHKLGQDWGFAT